MAKPAKKSSKAPDPKRNLILSSLPAAEYKNILSAIDLVDLPVGWTIAESGDYLDYLYFPVSGIVSMVYALEDGSTSETALVGREGIVGVSVYMGGHSMPTSTEVQSEGQAYRLDRKAMLKEFSSQGELHDLSLLFAQAVICQTSQIAVCNQHHTIDQQMCRWLLMSIDRLGTNKLTITQESIGKLLGVRRESVTQAVGQLHKDKVIKRGRGRMEVINRKKLENRVCECYAVVRDEYERLFPKDLISK